MANAPQALPYFQKAVAIDPNNAEAWAAIADSYAHMGADLGNGDPATMRAQATAALVKALELDPDLAEAHTTTGWVKLWYDWDWTGAEQEFRRAIELSPNSLVAHRYYSHYLDVRGREQQSRAHEWATHLRTIPSKRMIREALAYLEKEEMNALLEAPDANTAIGHRDRVLLLFLYNSGCRADEAAQVRIEDLELNERSHTTAFSSVRIMGKGRKVRYCPLSPKTVQGLLSIIEGRSNTQQHVFLNRYNQPLTRFGIHALVKRYVTKAGKSCRSLNNKRVSPHTIRHTTATHLLRAGVDLNTIRVWLGRVSIDTTNIYTEVDFETKARALTVCEIRPSLGRINPNPAIIGFLRRLDSVNYVVYETNLWSSAGVGRCVHHIFFNPT